MESEMLDTLRKINAFMIKTEKERKEVHTSQRDLMRKAREILLDMTRKEKRLLTKVESVLRNHERLLEKMLEVNRSVDETLCNVLLAIRQNEYLQAWYPAQQGQPEQKVVGKYVIAKKEGKEVA
jgi:hypothetical protein